MSVENFTNRQYKLAQFASLGVARTIYPVNTMSDGDTVFALSCGELQADINTLGVAAAAVHHEVAAADPGDGAEAKTRRGSRRTGCGARGRTTATR